ncbi:hypothetical protein D9M68_217990 [compost metagenome]
MNDWRNKPRNGKSQVVPLMAEIQTKLDLGHTIRAIYSEMLESGKLEIGYHQFTLHIKKLRRPTSDAGAVPKIASVTAGSEQVSGRPRRFIHNPTAPDNILD